MMMTVCFTYRLLDLKKTFNLSIIRFVHLGAQIGLKLVPYLNLSCMQILHLYFTRTKYFSYWMVITIFLLKKTALIVCIPIIMIITSLWFLLFWRPNLITFQICWLLYTVLINNVLDYWFLFIYLWFIFYLLAYIIINLINFIFFSGQR